MWEETNCTDFAIVTARNNDVIHNWKHAVDCRWMISKCVTMVAERFPVKYVHISVTKTRKDLGFLSNEANTIHFGWINFRLEINNSKLLEFTIA